MKDDYRVFHLKMLVVQMAVSLNFCISEELICVEMHNFKDTKTGVCRI